MHQDKLIWQNTYFKVNIIKYYLLAFLRYYISLDVCLTNFLFDESKPAQWFNRPGFTHSRKLLVLVWLFMGNFLLMGYKSNLRSSLIAINYEDKLKTLDDVAESGLPLMIANSTIFNSLLASDPRPVVRHLYKNAEIFPWNGNTPTWVRDK